MDSRPDPVPNDARRLSPGPAVLLPTGFALAVAAYAALPAVRSHPVLLPTFLGAGGVLLAWAAWLFVAATRRGRELTLRVTLKKPHYVQACAQLTLLLYWGWHVRPVYQNVPLVLAQLLFAYGLDALLQWSRRDTYHLGFGPIPIVLSINFFLWFRPDWYYWQFVIVALGYAAKEFITWTKEGRRAHIFNPSSFPLGVFSLVLILTGTTNTTFGLEIAQTLFNPPHIYLVIFLVALPAQMLFGVTTMTIASVVTAYVWGLLYFGVTGTYYFRDAFVPIAVFLGMHLLFTDPATSPRTELGRVMFGVLYAVLTIALAGVLEAVGAPTFFDKLLPIPVLNTLVRRLDRIAVTVRARLGDTLVLGRMPSGARYRLGVVGLWVVTFVGLSASGGVGDDHPGQYLPFWEAACATGSGRACDYAAIMQANYCDRGSGWACNELGVRRAQRDSDRAGALAVMQRSCDLDFTPGCRNVLTLTLGDAEGLERDRPTLRDLPIVLRGSKGPVVESTPEALYALGCERGWSDLCGRVATSVSAPARETGSGPQ